MESKFGQMVLITRETGKMIWLMEMGHSVMCLEIPMKVNGSETKPMVKGSTLIVTELHILVNGDKISNMVMALKFGLINHNMWANTIKDKNMVTDATLGKMVQIILENGAIIKYMDMVPINGLTTPSTRVIGSSISSLVTDCSSTPMETLTRVNG